MSSVTNPTIRKPRGHGKEGQTPSSQSCVDALASAPCDDPREKYAQKTISGNHCGSMNTKEQSMGTNLSSGGFDTVVASLSLSRNSHSPPTASTAGSGGNSTLNNTKSSKTKKSKIKSNRPSLKNIKMNTIANNVEKMNVQEERKMVLKDGAVHHHFSTTPSHEKDDSPVHVVENVMDNKENHRRKNRKNKKRSPPTTTTNIPAISVDSNSPLTDTGKVSVLVTSESKNDIDMDTKVLVKGASGTASTISPTTVMDVPEDSLSIAVVSPVHSGDENHQGGSGSSSTGTIVMQEDGGGTTASTMTKTSDSTTATTTAANGQKKKKKYSKWNRRNKNRSKNNKKSPTRSATPEKVIDNPEEEAIVVVEGNIIPPTNEIPIDSINDTTHVLTKPSTHHDHVDDPSTIVKDSDSTVAGSEVDSTVTTNAAGKAILEQLSSSTMTTSTMMTGTTTMTTTTTTTSSCSGPYSPVPTSTGTSYIEESFDCTPIPGTEEVHLNGNSHMNNMVMGGREHGQDHFDVSCIDFCMEHGHEQYCMDHALQPPTSPNDLSNDSSSFGHPLPPRMQPHHHQKHFVPSLHGQAPLPPPPSFAPYGGHPLPYMPMPIPLGPDGMPLMYHGPLPPTYGPTPIPNYGMDHPALSFPYPHPPPPPLSPSSSPPSHPNHDMMAYYPMPMPMGMPNCIPTSSSPPPLNTSTPANTEMKYEQVSVNGCTFFQPVLATDLDDCKGNGAKGGKDNGCVEDKKKKKKGTKGKQTKKKKYKKKSKAMNKKSQSNDANNANDLSKSKNEPAVIVTE